MARGMLESAGIECFLVGENVNNLLQAGVPGSAAGSANANEAARANCWVTSTTPKTRILRAGVESHSLVHVTWWSCGGRGAARCRCATGDFTPSGVAARRAGDGDEDFENFGSVCIRRGTGGVSRAAGCPGDGKHPWARNQPGWRPGQQRRSPSYHGQVAPATPPTGSTITPFRWTLRATTRALTSSRRTTSAWYSRQARALTSYTRRADCGR